MHTEFLAWDDRTLIVENEIVNQGLGLHMLLEALVTPVLNLWSPLALWSHQLDVSLFGMNPLAHHMMGLLYHLLAGVALWWALQKGFQAKKGQLFFVTGLFLIHPAQVESWAWISERKDTLAALFAFLSLGAWGCFLRERASRWGWLLLFFLLLSLMAKPTLVVWPLFLLMTGWQQRCRALWLILAGATLLSMGVAAITLLTQQGRDEMEVIRQVSLLERGVIGFANYARYLLRMIWPTNLAYFYPLPKALPLAGGLAGAALVLGMLWVNFKMGPKKPLLMVGLTLFLLTLAPVCGFILSGESYGPDRYGYLPYVGIFLALSSLLPKKTLGLTLFLLVPLSILSAKQAMTWRTMDTLTSHALDLNPSNYKAHAHRAQWLSEKQRPDEALHHWQETFHIRPDHDQAALKLGNEAMQKGAFAKAVDYFSKHQKYWAKSLSSASGLAAAKAHMGELHVAEQLYQKLVEEYPAREDFKLNLQKIRLMKREH